MPTLTVLTGDCIEQLKTLPDASVHCCVTSPPYYGLRDYGVEGQIGLEDTPELFVAKMVEVFREVKRVLRDDGTLWLNLGDSYADGGRGGGMEGDRGEKQRSNEGALLGRKKAPVGFKHKDLLGIPWMVAFALRADGWYLRSDIIWHKPNPMPESVVDRPTKSHEYVFLLSKNERYYYDTAAVREPYLPESLARYDTPMMGTAPAGRQPNGDADRRIREKGVREPNPMGRQRRTVWTIVTHSFKDAHFATYPPDLIKPCILAGTSVHGCCSKCGSPYGRLVENGEPLRDQQKACGGDLNGEYDGKATKDYASAKCQDPSGVKARILRGMVEKKTVGWETPCECSASVVPCTVIDPFGGSGTTGAVSLELGRNAVLIELNPEYVKLIHQRCNVTPGLALS